MFGLQLCDLVFSQLQLHLVAILLLSQGLECRRLRLMLFLQLLELTLVVSLLSCQILQVECQQILRLLRLLNLLVQAHLHLLVLVSRANLELFGHPQLLGHSK